MCAVWIVLDVFKYDPEFEKNEAQYDEIRQELIGDPLESSDEESEGEGEEQSEEENEKGEYLCHPLTLIIFQTNSLNLNSKKFIALRH